MGIHNTTGTGLVIIICMGLVLMAAIGFLFPFVLIGGGIYLLYLFHQRRQT